MLTNHAAPKVPQSQTWGAGHQDHVNLSAAFLVAAVFIGASATLLRLFFPRPRAANKPAASRLAESRA